jgi:hypothetical protein
MNSNSSISRECHFRFDLEGLTLTCFLDLEAKIFTVQSSCVVPESEDNDFSDDSMRGLGGATVVDTVATGSIIENSPSDSDISVFSLKDRIAFLKQYLCELEEEVEMEENSLHDYRCQVTDTRKYLDYLKYGLGAFANTLDLVQQFFTAFSSEPSQPQILGILSDLSRYLHRIERTVTAIYMNQPPTQAEQEEFAESIGKTLEEVQQPLTDPCDLLPDCDRVVLVPEV